MTGPWRASASSQRMYASATAPSSPEGSIRRCRSRPRAGNTRPKSSPSRAPSFARAFVRTAISGSPISAPSQPSSASTNGHAAIPPYERQWPSSHVTRSSASERSSSSSRVLPIPGSPTRRTIRPRPATRSPEHTEQPRHLVVASDERGRTRDLLARLRADEPGCRHRSRAPLDGQLARRLECEAVGEPPRRRVADENRAGLGEPLQAGGGVGRVPERDRPRRGGADLADGRLTGVDARPAPRCPAAPTPPRRPGRTRRRPRGCGARRAPRARDRPRARPGHRSRRRSRLPRTPAPCRRTPRRRGSSSSRTRRRAPSPRPAADALAEPRRARRCRRTGR